jgi:hypothetical protein
MDLRDLMVTNPTNFGNNIAGAGILLGGTTHNETQIVGRFDP